MTTWLLSHWLCPHRPGVQVPAHSQSGHGCRAVRMQRP